MRKSCFFLFRQTSTFAISASFGDMITIQLSKSIYFTCRIQIRDYFWRTRTSTRAARHVNHSTNPVFDNIFEYGKLRAHLARGQVRARKFGARHRIEHHQSNILCIYNIFISLKVAEIECFEVFRDRRPSLKIRENKKFLL